MKNCFWWKGGSKVLAAYLAGWGAGMAALAPTGILFNDFLYSLLGGVVTAIPQASKVFYDYAE